MRSFKEALGRLTASISKKSSSSPRFFHRPSMRTLRPSSRVWKHFVSAPIIDSSTPGTDSSYGNSRVSGFRPPHNAEYESGNSPFSANRTLDEWCRKELSRLDAIERDCHPGKSLAERRSEAETNLSKAISMKQAALESYCDNHDNQGLERDRLVTKIVYHQAELSEVDATSQLTDISMAELRRERLLRDYVDLSRGSRPQRRTYDEHLARTDGRHGNYLSRLDLISAELGLGSALFERSTRGDRSNDLPVSLAQPSAMSSTQSFDTVPTNASSTCRSTSVMDKNRNERRHISDQISLAESSIPVSAIENSAIENPIYRSPGRPSSSTSTNNLVECTAPSIFQAASSIDHAAEVSHISDTPLTVPDSASPSTNEPDPSTQVPLTTTPYSEEDFEYVDYFPRQPRLYSSSSTAWASQKFTHTPLSTSPPQNGLGEHEDQRDQSTRLSTGNPFKSALDSVSRFAGNTRNKFVRFAGSHSKGFLSKADSGRST